MRRASGHRPAKTFRQFPGVVLIPASRISEKQIDHLVSCLRSVAYNLWWSWNPSAQQIFHELSPFFWEESNHNAVEILNWISGQELRARLASPEFFGKVQAVCRTYHSYMEKKDTWARKHAPRLKHPVAYFSAEFGLHESLRIYSGGLGILAGDHTKSASDLGIPFVAVSLFYRQGYFRQTISNDGWQQEHYPTYDPARLPIRPVTGPGGVPIVCSVMVGSSTVRFRAWTVEVGRTTIILLDTDLPENEQRFRDLTAHVYGGDQANRIGQEILLGIGGVRMLRAMKIAPSLYHMNEGHSAFLTLELLREHIASGKPPQDAEKDVRSHCLFTTHTPVPAGHDRFDQGLMDEALGRFAASLGTDTPSLMKYGRVHPDDPNEPFTMTVLALRMSRGANGVSELHGQVSREMWKEVHPGNAHKIGHVTNGIHTPGWTSHTASAFWTRKLGVRWIDRLHEPAFWKQVLSSKVVSDLELWSLRTILRRELVEAARRRLQTSHLVSGGTHLGAEALGTVLSPDALTIGFARRFATYKRAPLFFRDLPWALRILLNQERPVQIVFAGKAHPRDDAGKQFIQQIVNLTKRMDLFRNVVFLEDYDINVARYLVAGADVWLNTPRRPMEASGTSGMKTIIHGGLHLSTMDGWWREAYNGRNGWKIGEDREYSDEHQQDEADAESLRRVVEETVIPLFYKRGKDGIPHEWLKMVRQSIATLAPKYNTHRMVIEYAEKYYLSKRD
jgi:starch phosphorylase